MTSQRSDMRILAGNCRGGNSGGGDEGLDQEHQTAVRRAEGSADAVSGAAAQLHWVLAMVAVAMMFAAEGPTAVVRFWNDIAGHGPRRMERLLRALGLEKLPSHDAVGRVMAATDPDPLHQGVAGGRRAQGRGGGGGAAP